MKRLALVTLVAVATLAGSGGDASADERTAASIADICALGPGLLSAVNTTVSTYPYQTYTGPPDILTNLFYYADAVEMLDTVWCRTASQMSHPEGIRNTMLWHYGNASQAMRDYQQAASRSAPAPAPTAAPAPASISFDQLDGRSFVMGADTENHYAQFLGDVSSNCFAANSITNEFGAYGSEFSATSIRNEFGAWGSQFSTRSATNEFASTPPIVVRTSDQKVIGYLSENIAKLPRIDTSNLLGYLKGAGGC